MIEDTVQALKWYQIRPVGYSISQTQNGSLEIFSSISLFVRNARVFYWAERVNKANLDVTENKQKSTHWYKM